MKRKLNTKVFSPNRSWVGSSCFGQDLLYLSHAGMPVTRDAQCAQRAKRRANAQSKRYKEVKLPFPDGPPTTLTQRLAMSWMSRSMSDHITMGTISNLIVEFIVKSNPYAPTPNYLAEEKKIKNN
jgi:hypothetical protein